MTPLVLGLAIALAAPAPKKTDEAAPGKVEGDWGVESMEPAKEAPPGSVTMRFADGKISISEGGRDRKETAGYTVDLTRKPATIDIRPEGRPAGVPEMVVQGIIEIKGDTMKLCFGKDGSERPTEFKGDMDKRVMLITLKRAKAGK